MDNMEYGRLPSTRSNSSTATHGIQEPLDPAPQDLELSTRRLVFLHIIILQVLVNYDSGAIAVCHEFNFTYGDILMVRGDYTSLTATILLFAEVAWIAQCTITARCDKQYRHYVYVYVYKRRRRLTAFPPGSHQASTFL